MKQIVTVKLPIDHVSVMLSALWDSVETLRSLDNTDAVKVEQICEVADISHHLMNQFIQQIKLDNEGGTK